METVKDILAQRNEIMKKSLGGIDYSNFEKGGLAFDYEALMKFVGYPMKEVLSIQRETKVGNTPLYELKNLTKLVRKISLPGKGARILIKDEAMNASGSFKDRRAALSLFQAKKEGYQGVVAATSGNYGAAVASQALQRGLKCIIAQEVFDSRGIGQPEILEKGRKCEALGAEVWQLTVGPELFFWSLQLLKETGYFNASLYTPYGIRGIEALGYEIGMEVKTLYGREPSAVLITHAGGGNVTGTARGLLESGCFNTRIIGVSVDLRGLHMASDTDFNRKSFTTGHTGFGVPFAVNPDRVDVPRNAARPLRYLDRYLLITQGEVFYATELFTRVEGIERGPAGNTSLAAAIPIAREMPEDEILVIQETEYTGAGKHPTAQLTFARKMGIEIIRGNPQDNIPGKRIVIPENLRQLSYEEYPLAKLKQSYLEHTFKKYEVKKLSLIELKFLQEELKDNNNFVIDYLNSKGVIYE
ncbi:MAG: 2-amino-4-ketopentanoate thiolase beta subunit [candidate division WS2 bacterium]|nr:2-amino-4-ketopentanoate thiolase beta subunit [Candidatus Lithacetigena glycinireducens]